LLLRQDNADERLTERSYRMGLASFERYKKWLDKRDAIMQLIGLVNDTSVNPAAVESYLIAVNSKPIPQRVRLRDLCLRPEITLRGLIEYLRPEWLEKFSGDVIFSAELAVKYSVYIEREREMANKLRRLDELIIPENFDFSSLNISTEAKQKLLSLRPTTIGQASRIPGVSPADINAMLVYMGR